MLFSQLRHSISRYARVVLLAYVLVLGYLLLSDHGRIIVNELGERYIKRQDLQKQRQAAELNWAALMALGDISRHHRYATYKDQIWFELVSAGTKLDKSHLQWAERNKRNIDMQLMLAQYYQTQGKAAKELKLLSKLYAQVPEHPELAQAYHQAQQHLKANTSKAKAQQLQSLNEYFGQ